MADSGNKRTYRFYLKTLDESRPVSAAVEEVKRLAPEIAASTAGADAKFEVKVKREENIPVDPLTIFIVVEVINLAAKPLLEGFFKKLGEKMADSLSDQIRNLVVLWRDEPEPESSPQPESQNDKRRS